MDGICIASVVAKCVSQQIIVNKLLLENDIILIQTLARMGGGVGGDKIHAA